MITYAAIEPETSSFRGVCDSVGDEQSSIPEHLLWKLWKRRAARKEQFRTGSGTRVRVLYPGRTGSAAGPDFRDALLDVEGLGLVRGDVEIHLRQRDWDAHGHGGDPNYSGVVIHGALQVDSPDTVLSSGASASVVSLAGLLDGEEDDESYDPDESQVASDLWALLARRGYSRPVGPAEVGDLLDRAGDERFRRRAALLGRFAADQGPEQTLYEALLEGLGYRHNQQPFVKLAQAAPISALRRSALPVLKEQRPMVLRHWLQAVAGLNGKAGVPPRLPTGVGPAMERKDWHMFRVRPANHPAARIDGAAELVARFLEGGLVDGLSAECGSPSRLAAALTVEARGSDSAPVGTGRARDLAVNSVLPLLHSLEGVTDSPYLSLYRRFPKLQGNEVVREMSEQLFPEAPLTEVNSARRQQGLLHLASLLRGGS